MSFTRLMILPLLTPWVLTGCLGSTYHIAGEELDRLARLPAAERSEVVRATQELSFSEQDDSGDVTVEAADIPSLILNLAQERDTYRSGPILRRHRSAPTSTEVHARPVPRVSVGVNGPIETDGRPVVQVRGESSTIVRAAAAGSSDVDVRGGNGSGGRTSSGSSGTDALDGAAAVVAIIAVVAVVAGIGILVAAGSEGARFDGWLQLERDQPLHLYRRDRGEEQWATLGVSELTPAMAAWADGALVDPAEGAIYALARAPLDRTGFVFSVLGEGSALDVGDGRSRQGGGGARILLGGFAFHNLGLMIAADIQGGSNVLNTRLGGELQAYLPSFGVAALGLYVEAGLLWARRYFADGSEVTSAGYFGSGLIFQTELTTRLAFEVRGGVWTSGGRLFPTFGAGLAVY